ncbi:hypothetical protein [Brachybacterium sp. J153]|uniref:hypothetical protein n=1 Tax=Brachybacterium sp. J153 TaxID=3116488 RepID=UPI002E7603E6|nr:hypothetical protein [Brachybacterium sp. J153]MEE1619398.1 hypothetical protein [Brachybacterium sp. J153]
MTTAAEAPRGFSPRVALQKVGTSLSNMVMPNIPALIAWGILAADHPLFPAVRDAIAARKVQL